MGYNQAYLSIHTVSLPGKDICPIVDIDIDIDDTDRWYRYRYIWYRHVCNFTDHKKPETIKPVKTYHNSSLKMILAYLLEKLE